MPRHFPVLFLALPLLTLLGCGHAQPAAAPTKPPQVLVSLPVTKEVTDYEEFTGHTETAAGVDVRARVTGYLDKVNFIEGAEVNKGDVLFEIDPRPYRAELNRGEANLVQAEAHRNRLDADYQRAQTLVAKRAMSQEEFDKVAGDRAE